MPETLPKRACASCLKSFRPTRRWSRFCSTSCRRTAARETLEYTCEYCGIVADSVDHVPPTSIRPTLVDLGLDLHFPFFEVRACRECNSTLSDRGLWTLGTRRAYIAERLKKRYRRYLEIPDWTPDELMALEERLRKLTIQGLAVRDLTLRRIERAMESADLSPSRFMQLWHAKFPAEPKPEPESEQIFCLSCRKPTIGKNEYCSWACCDSNELEEYDAALGHTYLKMATDQDLENIEKRRIKEQQKAIELELEREDDLDLELEQERQAVAAATAILVAHGINPRRIR